MLTGESASDLSGRRKWMFSKPPKAVGKHWQFMLGLLMCSLALQLLPADRLFAAGIEEGRSAILVKGKVIAKDNGQPLPGVNIIIKGTGIAAITDTEGNYSINVPKEDDVLVFSFVGFTTQSVTVGGRSMIDVTLVEAVQNLESVVVVGYGTLDKKEVTSAISHISSKDLSVVSSNDPLMKLQGKVSGLTVQNTAAADPNGRASIQLRGIATRSTATGPLIVIDGVPGGNLLSVNENDIESIDVLKDGAASAIYGTRASNGVILITTKRGMKGQGQLSYNGYVSFDSPTMALKPLSPSEFRANNRGTDFGADTDWMDLISNKYAFTQKHSVSYMGGGSSTSYRATVDYQNSSGLDIASGRQQYGARLGINHTGGDGLYNIILNVTPRYAKGTTINRSVFNEGLLLNPTVPLMDPKNPALYHTFGGYDEFNPVEALKLQQMGIEQKYLDWNTTFKLNLLPNLNTQVQIAQVSADAFDYSFSPSNMTTQIIAGQTGTAARSYSKSDQYSLEWLANYYLDIKKHSFKFLGVYSYQYFVNSGLSAGNSNFPTNATTYNNLNSGTYNMVAGRNGFGTSKSDNRLISFRTRLNYSYDDKYLFSASLTRDGSSKFGANNKWGYFPGVSAGWRIKAEPFMQRLQWVNDLKIRADYGETGNQDAIGNYTSLPTYQGYGQYEYNGSYMQVYGPSSNINPNLKWERLKNWNIGLDFTFFDYRLNGTVNYYNRRAVDLLGTYNAPLPPNIALTTVVNVGSMKSKGLEIDLNASIVKKKNFSYNIALNGATQNSSFVSFSNDLYKGQTYIDQIYMPAPGSPGPTQRMQEGKRLGMFYFWKYAGVDDKGDFMVFNKEGKAIPAALATENDKQFLGNGQPKFTGGMTHIVKYRNWDASASFRGVFGWDIFNVHEFYYGMQSAAFNSNVLPSAYGKNATIKGLPVLTNYFLEKGDFVKLDVITLGYTLRLKVKQIQSVRFYASTRNLLTITGFKGVDPDLYPINGQNPGIFSDPASPNSGTKAYYPSTKQLLLGLQVTF